MFSCFGQTLLLFLLLESVAQTSGLRGRFPPAPLHDRSLGRFITYCAERVGRCSELAGNKGDCHVEQNAVSWHKKKESLVCGLAC